MLYYQYGFLYTWAVAAARLGAGRLTGIDMDPMAVSVARNNLALNKIDATRFELSCGHLVDNIVGTFDVVVANILAEVIIELLDDVRQVVKPGGILICSGIIEAYQAAVGEKMAACGFNEIDIQKDGDWVAIMGRLPQKTAYKTDA